MMIPEDTLCANDYPYPQWFSQMQSLARTRIDESSACA